jgi:Tol biopolymer transport system component
MGESSEKTQSMNSPGERLDSWKEIAAYLGRDVTTAQRWEKRERMPVHRHVHDRLGSVYAFRAELDEWVRSRHPDMEQENGNSASATNGAAPAHELNAPSALGWKLAIALVAAVAILAIGARLWLQRAGYFWQNPIGNARFEAVTGFDGIAEAAAISRDGQFVAFLSDRDGQMDVWVTQVGSGQVHNLTRGRAPELVNPSIRTLGFSPDGALVTFWVRRQTASGAKNISIWAVPTLGGEPRPYLEDAAEYAWSPDGTRLAYHTTAAGDPLFVSDGRRRPEDRPIFTAPAGMHAHFPLWSSDSAFIYFVQGALPDKLNVWRISPAGGRPQQITRQAGRVRYPVLLDGRTLLYLSSDADGSGLWLYGMDAERRVPHRLSFGPEMYTSLAASADGLRLAATVASPQTTLWRMRIGDSRGQTSTATRIAAPTDSEYSPRLGPDYLLYVSSSGASASVWKLASGTSTELWRGADAQVTGAPAISPDGRRIAFAALQRGQKLLYVMQADGTGARVVADSLELQGDPAWTPDGQSITSAANERGVPHLFRVPVSGASPVPFVRDYALDPAWAPGGDFVVYSGPDIGTTFSVKAATAQAAAHPLPALTLTRGARHVAILQGGKALVFLQGDIQHKNLWIMDLGTGAERQLTNLPADFDVRDFDISPDGKEVVLERAQERSEVVLLELPQPRTELTQR